MLARFLLGIGEIRESESVWWVLSGEGGHVKASGGRQCLRPGQAESTPALFVPCEWDWPSDIMEPGGCLLGNFSNIRTQSLAFLTCERFASASVGLKHTNYSPRAKSTSMWKLLSCVWLFATPWTIQSMEFSRPEHWSVCSFPFSRGLPNPQIEPRSPVLQADSLPAKPQGQQLKATLFIHRLIYQNLTVLIYNNCTHKKEKGIQT